MFYAHFVLAKKGPLARIWLAAHWDKKLTKAHVFETNIQKSVEDILHPKVKIALRTSGHLLLGVVRIYSRKAKYLLADCNEAFVKIKMAFRPGMVDLPEENREAAVHAITLPEVFHDFDANIPDLNDAEMQAQFTMNQSRAEEITMREDYGCQLPPLSHDDDGFGDIGFGDSAPLELIRDGTSIEHSLEPGSFFGDLRERCESRRNRPPTRTQSGSNTPVRDDGFGGNLGSDIIGGGLFEGGGLFDDAPLGDVPSLNEPSDLENKTQEKESLGDHMMDNDSDDDRMDAFDAPPSVGASSDSSRPGSPFGAGSGAPRSLLSPKSPLRKHEGSKDIQDPVSDKGHIEPPDVSAVAANEDDGFALAPLDITAVKGWARHKRKRKLIIDEVKNISGEEMKSQLSDTSDIVTTLDLAPPTRRLMHWKETGGVEKLFALPGRPIPARLLFKDYQRHLTSQPTEIDDFGLTMDMDKENSVENARNAEPSDSYRQDTSIAMKSPAPKRTQGRKRKAQSELEHDAEDHQKQRELQYQSLLAPSPMVTQEKIPDATFTDPGMNASIPALPEPETPQLDSTFQVAADTPFTPAPHIPEMENMGYQASMMPLEADDGFGGLPMATPGLISERAPPTPWHDDYEMAPSVGPMEEQLADETYEQFEERVLNKRASAMYNLVKAKLQLGDVINLREITARCNKKQVAQKFYTLLVLKKNQAIELDQGGCYADIMISRGRKFECPTL